VPANDVSTEPASLTRARAFVGRGRFLQGAGGRDPGAPGPEGACGSRVGCDGPGFVAWCLEAESTGRWFQPLAIPEVGALIVYPSIELVRAGRIDRRGHVGLIAVAPPSWPRHDARWTALRVIHCAASLQRRHGYAIGETHAVAWSSRATFQGQSHPRWRTRFLRYVRDRLHPP
jgi:hypothetical protein